QELGPVRPLVGVDPLVFGPGPVVLLVDPLLAVASAHARGLAQGTDNHPRAPTLSPDADALPREERPGPVQSAVDGERIPVVGDALLVHEVAEAPERTLSPDRPLQALPQRRVVLPLREGHHVLPPVAGAGAVDPQPPVGFLLDVD